MKSSRKIYLDSKHSGALLHLLADENIIDTSAPVAFNQINTVGDLIRYRNPSTLPVTDRDKRETLLFLSIFDEVQLHVPKGLFGSLDLAPLGGGIIPLGPGPQSRRS
jgi:hypothetical protein